MNPNRITPDPKFQSRNINMLSKRYDELFIYKESLCKTWKPQSEIWPFTYGDNVVSGLTALTSIGITFLFRKAVKIRPYARMTCYMPVVGMSVLGSFAIHSFVISCDVVSANSCPSCIQAKSNLLQLAIGLGYPIICASTVCFYTAEKLMTYPIPPLLRAPKEVFTLFQNILLKTPRTYFVIGGLHMIVTSFITFKKQKTFMKIEKEMMSSEQRK